MAELNQAWQAAIDAEAQPDAGAAAWPLDGQQALDTVDAAGLQALLALEEAASLPPPPALRHPMAHLPRGQGRAPVLRLVPNPSLPTAVAAGDGAAAAGPVPAPSGTEPG